MRFSTKCVWFKSLDRWDKSGWEKLLCITLWSDLLHEGASGGLAPQFYFWAPQFQLHTKKQNKHNKMFFSLSDKFMLSFCFRTMDSAVCCVGGGACTAGNVTVCCDQQLTQAYELTAWIRHRDCVTCNLGLVLLVVGFYNQELLAAVLTQEL